jgi:peptidoglycan/LPS O-acetylase OafA/YrhL
VWIMSTVTVNPSGIRSTKNSAKKGSPVFWRCLASWSVFHSHQYAIQGLPEPGIGTFGLSLGGLGVITFFALSGYYVMGSYMARPWSGYALSRLRRIMPAMMVSVLLITGVLGFFSTLALAHYVQHPQTWAFLKHNGLLGFYPLARQLPGVFEQNALPWVNPSWWTLPYIWLVYALLPLLWARKLWPLLTVLALAGGFWALFALAPFNWQVRLGHAYDVFYLCVFTMVFFAGVAVRQLPLNWHLVVALYTAVIGLFGWMVGYWPLLYGASLLLWTVMMLWVCTRFHLDRYVAAWGDPSYGMYLYAFPVQQVCAQLLAKQGFMVSYGVALVVTIMLGYASWHWIEKPLSGWKPGFIPLKRPAKHFSPAL